MRKLEYTLTPQDGELTVRQVMKDRLQLSAKEISHAKHFEDGIMAELDLRLGGESRRYLHKEQPVDGCVRVRVNEYLYPGESLVVTLHEMEDDKGRIIAVPGPIEIIYEDADIILLNKPAGIVAHPSPGHGTDSLANRLAYYYEEKGEPHRIRIIGRLDKEASGVLLFAKTRMAARALRREAAYDKEYLAVCSGSFSREEESGTIKFPILKRPEVILKREISQEGEEAITHYKVTAQGADMALVRLKLETGRTHQIRLHMAAIGHPLIGDSIYNTTGADAREGMKCEEIRDEDTQAHITHAMLHAEKMHITHPVSGQDMTFCAEIHKDMRRLIARIHSR